MKRTALLLLLAVCLLLGPTQAPASLTIHEVYWYSDSSYSVEALVGYRIEDCENRVELWGDRSTPYARHIIIGCDNPTGHEECRYFDGTTWTVVPCPS